MRCGRPSGRTVAHQKCSDAVEALLGPRPRQQARALVAGKHPVAGQERPAGDGPRLHRPRLVACRRGAATASALRELLVARLLERRHAGDLAVALGPARRRRVDELEAQLPVAERLARGLAAQPRAAAALALAVDEGLAGRPWRSSPPVELDERVDLAVVRLVALRRASKVVTSPVRELASLMQSPTFRSAAAIVPSLDSRAGSSLLCAGSSPPPALPAPSSPPPPNPPKSSIDDSTTTITTNVRRTSRGRMRIASSPRDPSADAPGTRHTPRTARAGGPARAAGGRFVARETPSARPKRRSNFSSPAM